MKKENLEKICRGFYVDRDRALYIDMKELLTTHSLPDRPEVRQALLEQVRLEFGVIDVTELSE
jgi:hypothetical protein